jgi:hypothetical protein
LVTKFTIAATWDTVLQVFVRDSRNEFRRSKPSDSDFRDIQVASAHPSMTGIRRTTWHVPSDALTASANFPLKPSANQLQSVIPCRLIGSGRKGRQMRGVTGASSDRFLISAVLAAFGLFSLGQIIFDNLVYAWLMHALAQHIGALEAEVLAKSSAIALLSLTAGLSVVCLNFYLKRKLAKLVFLS